LFGRCLDIVLLSANLFRNIRFLLVFIPPGRAFKIRYPLTMLTSLLFGSHSTVSVHLSVDLYPYNINFYHRIM